MARKAGKPNTFLKGMKVDMDPAFPPKSSYRFARNAKILSNDSDSVAIQPYPSDREVLTLCPEIVTVAQNIGGVIGFGDTNTYSYGLTGAEGTDMEFYYIGQTNWSGLDHDALSGQIANDNGFPMVNFLQQPTFDNNIAPIPVVSVTNAENATSLNESFLLQATITLNNGATQTLYFNTNNSFNPATNPTDFSTAIGNNDLPFTPITSLGGQFKENLSWENLYQFNHVPNHHLNIKVLTLLVMVQM